MSDTLPVACRLQVTCHAPDGPAPAACSSGVLLSPPAASPAERTSPEGTPLRGADRGLRNCDPARHTPASTPASTPGRARGSDGSEHGWQLV